MTSGYYRQPTIHGDSVIFVCEDDLWTVSAAGGVARRLTAGRATTAFPVLSPDGSRVAFVSSEEGQPEVYAMDAAGGPMTRLTFLGGAVWKTLGWDAHGRVLYNHSADQPFPALTFIYVLDTTDLSSERVPVGPARAISYGPGGAVVIGLNNRDPARWKRYRGGMAGQIWIDADGDGSFRPLLDLSSNLDCPMWLGDRIYFLSDHEGVGNLYSCLPDGGDIQRHTHHDDFYARDATNDGRRIVYSAGADLYVYDLAGGATRQIEIAFHSSQTQRNRRFVPADRYLDSWNLHPEGHSVAITTRGKAFTFGLWEGAVTQHGREDDARYRLLTWLNDKQRLIAVSDAGGEEQFVILHADDSQPPEWLDGLDIGRPIGLCVSPQKDQIVFSNHRHELQRLDLATRELTLIDRGKASRIYGYDWSPDGEWVVYSVSLSQHVSVLKLWQAATGATHQITRPVLLDVRPRFDPQGRYIVFLSYREFDPVFDNLQFDLNFPRGVRPYLITLQADAPNPFLPETRPPGTPNGSKSNGKGQPAPRAAATSEPSAEEAQTDAEAAPGKNTTETAAGSSVPSVKIDLEGIMERMLPFPVEEGRFGQIMITKDGKALYSRYPVEGILSQNSQQGRSDARGIICLYDFDKLEESTLHTGITAFGLSRDKTTLIYRAGDSLRVLKAGARPDSNSTTPGRSSGWIDLDRVKVSIEPPREWRQMMREAWRLQRDHFWTPDMAEVDWVAVYERYLPLVDRIASRSEFSDLMWEMQGELGTSHTYESGGDYPPRPTYSQGFLGAELRYDAASTAWVIDRIIEGDAWDERQGSPLRKPGVNVKPGDRLLAINGRSLSADFTPAMALVNLAGEQVMLTVAAPAAADDDAAPAPRTVDVTALASERSARYREWVESNRSKVHAATDGRVGYVHVPNMMALGYAEFHRGYLAEVDRESLIVDVRFNGGGNVSGLILEKLARRRIGYSISRWSDVPAPYPNESVLGPIVALTNEHAGSDGDIFSHGFKLMQLGPLLGTRTWGGVIGIWPRHALVDRTTTTQPEYAFWFEDVGWGVENYGTDPDIVVHNTPQDYVNGRDAQLERAIEEALQLLAANPPQMPAFDQRPSRALPVLPSNH